MWQDEGMVIVMLKNLAGLKGGRFVLRLHIYSGEPVSDTSCWERVTTQIHKPPTAEQQDKHFSGSWLEWAAGD